MVSIVILAAGQGTRMNSAVPKILHHVGGKPIVHHVIDAALVLDPRQIVIVTSPTLDQEKVKDGRTVECVIQKVPQGTGDAVRQALPLLDGDEDVLILCGDTPLIHPRTLQCIVESRLRFPQGIIVVGMRLENPRSYGRLVTDAQSKIHRIVETKDATPEELSITLCNSGIILAKGSDLKKLLVQLKPHNAAQEYYLTDIVALGFEQGIPSWAIEIDDIESLHGINTRVELAYAEAQMQQRWRMHHMLNGVTLIDPASVFFCYDTLIEQDTIIHPNVTFGKEVIIGKNVTIYPCCHLSQVTIKNFAKVGPFAHVRDQTILEEGAEVGNFVELKKTILEAKAKVKHLSYIGDAMIGAKANIGAGTITCNYNGFTKSPTMIGAGAFIGSNTSLVAPVNIGQGAIVAAGSVITQDVPENSLAIARGAQSIKVDWAVSFRNKFIQN